MKTDVISLYGDLGGQSKAMAETEHFSEYLGLTGKTAMHLRLLTEEAISMVHGIVQDFEGSFWLESEQTEKGTLCRICVTADVDVSDGQEAKLLDVATSGKNEAAKGIIGKIRQVLRWSLQHTDDEDLVKQSWYEMGAYGPHATSVQAVGSFWSLADYRKKVENADAAESERDELEKSIVAKLADEVKVGIRSGKAEVMIEKLIPNA